MAIESERHRKRSKVSRPKGSNPFDRSRPAAKTFHAVMFWGAICEGRRGPFHIWERETIEEATHLKAVMDKENERKQNIVDMERELAQIPGTYERGVLQERNANIQRLDRENPLPSGYPRKQRRIDWEFKVHEKETRDGKSKGGVDWIRYRETILYPKLYPWAKQIHDETGRFVHIVEDNAGAHEKAKRLSWEGRADRSGIDVVDWPPLSPDLNKIERIWGPMKDYVEELRVTTHQNTLAREAIKTRATHAWYLMPQDKIDSECRDFSRKLHQCLANQGNNNFYG
ncbi:hypothetical protein K469DRAFT_261448 [Zopfia rhizophila CBS 207.26]|uniref:Tc1-like transposase DDE domain-containing protein n=1 Tax=Zopfia rhizophila CBS 207.26 TaxID=1314779 RepID=A0A6A6DQG9_9PEZI|nr:hypothetical protein K469DRAFT_261448 [Zopfia rhizophila CBS 207.26]